MKHQALVLCAATLLLAAPAASRAAIATYSQDFESLVPSDPAALSNDGWLVYGNVFTPAHVYMYGYGPYPAPNGGTAFSAIASGQGGAAQGNQQLSVYNDYNNSDHALGNLVEANVYREWTVAAGDVGTIWTFQFDAKLGNLVPPSTAVAFIKTLDPSQNYLLTNYVTKDMTNTPSTWSTYQLSLGIDPSLAGQIIQIGFSSTATGYLGSGVFYDNLDWTGASGVGVEPSRTPLAADLRPAAPNPFAQSTRLEYSLPARGRVNVTVYDVAGRRVATLVAGTVDAGPHVAVWDGRFEDGRLAPAGVYRGVLRTANGQVARSLVLSR